MGTKLQSTLTAVAGFLLLQSGASIAEGGQSQSAFKPAHTVEVIQAQMRRLPTDDIWWTVNGKDMAWNFRNLHRIFPSAKVYRSGPVRQLRHRQESV